MRCPGVPHWVLMISEHVECLRPLHGSLSRHGIRRCEISTTRRLLRWPSAPGGPICWTARRRLGPSRLGAVAQGPGASAQDVQHHPCKGHHGLTRRAGRLQRPLPIAGHQVRSSARAGAYGIPTIWGVYIRVRCFRKPPYETGLYFCN